MLRGTCRPLDMPVAQWQSMICNACGDNCLGSLTISPQDKTAETHVCYLLSLTGRLHFLRDHDTRNFFEQCGVISVDPRDSTQLLA
jgi:hypothetical protein